MKQVSATGATTTFPTPLLLCPPPVLVIWTLRPQNGPGDSLFGKKFEGAMILDPSYPPLWTLALPTNNSSRKLDRVSYPQPAHGSRKQKKPPTAQPSRISAILDDGQRTRKAQTARFRHTVCTWPQDPAALPCSYNLATLGCLWSVVSGSPVYALRGNPRHTLFKGRRWGKALGSQDGANERALEGILLIRYNLCWAAMAVGFSGSNLGVSPWVR